ncbi:hypothetical protein ACIGXM_29460 [Kitasatospora sp. NPDC052896]|uniref:hypothetical protein n=1 Tax=Kitasatospora sp. NPDC052896 TaxID=3364061 RepID=UPI0037C6C3C7
MRRSVDGGPSGRIGPGGRGRPFAARTPRQWVVTTLLSGLCWWLVLGGGLPAGGTATVLGLLTLAGWGLGVLPIHSDHRLSGPQRRAPQVGLAPHPQSASGGVETGLLQDGAQH